MTIRHYASTLFFVMTFTQFSACSSGPPPRQELSLTQNSIRSAETAGAARYAPKLLRTAQQKVETAQGLIKTKQYDDAKAILQTALADAELAEATAETTQSKLAYQQLQQNIDLMQKEFTRVQH